MTKAVKIPVTVKMRAGWNDDERNAPTLARMVEDAGAAAVAVHGRTAAQSYSGSADWELVARIADELAIPVFGSGDCIEPEQIVERMRVRRRRRARRTRRPAQPVDSRAGRGPRRRPPAARGDARDRGRFLLDYIDLLLHERVDDARALSHDRWVVNKLRALASWYTKGLEGGSRLRTAINTADSLNALTEAIATFSSTPARRFEHPGCTRRPARAHHINRHDVSFRIHTVLRLTPWDEV